MKTQPPCRDCKKRYLSCHSNCNEYKSWCAMNEAERQKKIEHEEMCRAFFDAKSKVRALRRTKTKQG